MTLIQYKVCRLIVALQETLKHHRPLLKLVAVAAHRSKKANTDHVFLETKLASLPQSAARRL